MQSTVRLASRGKPAFMSTGLSKGSNAIIMSENQVHMSNTQVHRAGAMQSAQAILN